MEQDFGRFFDLLYRFSPEKSFYYAIQIHKPTGETRHKFYRTLPEYIEAINSNNTGSDFDNYFSPASYYRPTRAIKSNVAGASVVWTDCDSGLPEFDQTPNILVETSPNHYHAYWTLEEFKSPEEIEAINRDLATRFNTDRSGWDSTQLLRPPGSLNRKRGNAISKIIHIQTDTQSTFSIQPISVPDASKSDTLQEEVGKLLAELVFTQKVRELLFKVVSAPGRSKHMFATACELVRMNLSDDELLLLMKFQDDRLQKFTNHPDRDTTIKGLISNARGTVKIPSPVVYEKANLYEHFLGETKFQEDNEVEEDDIVQHLLGKDGLIIIGGEPGAGKSRFTLQMLDHIACGKPFLGKEIPIPQVCCYISLDMNKRRVLEIRRKQYLGLHDSEKELIEKNLHKFIRGHGLNLTEKELQKQVKEDILSTGATIVAIDVLGRAVQSLIDDVMAVQFLDWIQTMMVDDHLSFILVSHTRKGSVGVKIKNSLDDLYGSRHWSISPDGLYILEQGHETNAKLLIAKDRTGNLGEMMPLFKNYDHSTFLLQSDEQKKAEENEDEEIPGTGVNI